MIPMSGRGYETDHDRQKDPVVDCARQLGLKDKFAVAAHSYGVERGLLVKAFGIKVVRRHQQTDPATMRDAAEAG